MAAPTTGVSPNAPPSNAAPVTPTVTGGRRRRGTATSWMAHVKATMRANKGLKLKQVLKLAKKTYKKAKKGGATVITPAAALGGRRRGTRRSRARRGGKDGDMQVEEKDF